MGDGKLILELNKVIKSGWQRGRFANHPRHVEDPFLLFLLTYALPCVIFDLFRSLVTGADFVAFYHAVDSRAAARGKAAPSDMSDFAMPPAGRSLPTLWVDNSSHAADHAAAGDFQVSLGHAPLPVGLLALGHVSLVAGSQGVRSTILWAFWRRGRRG